MVKGDFMVLHFAFLGEGIVALGSIDGAADDEVVDESEAHGVGGFGEIPGKGFVRSAGGGVSGRMVVRDGKIWGLVDENRAKDFGDRGNCLIG